MTYQRAIIGYDLDGKLDRGFADSGALILPPPFATSPHAGFLEVDWFERSSVVVDSENRLYALGTGAPESSHHPEVVDILLGRFSESGELDGGYGEAGVVNLSTILGSSVFRAGRVRAITSDRSGRLLVALEFHNGGSYVANALLRLTTDGRRDDTFVALVPRGGTPHNFINDVAVDADGRVLVLLGAQYPSHQTRWAQPNHLDPSYVIHCFSSDGQRLPANLWDPDAGGMWDDRTHEPTAIYGAWSIAVSGDHVFAWGAAEDPAGVSDRHSTFLHRFGSDGFGDKAWFDKSLRTATVNGWSDAPSIQEEGFNLRLLVRHGGRPVTYGEPHFLNPTSSPSAEGYVFFMNSDGSARGSPLFVGDEIVDAIVVKEELVGLLCRRNHALRLHGVTPDALLADWGSDTLNLEALRSNPYDLLHSAARSPKKYLPSNKLVWSIDEYMELKQRLAGDGVTAFEWDGRVEPVNLAKSSARLYAAVLLEVVED